MRKTYINYIIQHKYKVLQVVQVVLSHFKYKIKTRDKNLDNSKSYCVNTRKFKNLIFLDCARVAQ